MSEFSKNRQKAIEWMYTKKDRVKWWRWSVLTKRNSTDPSALGLSDHDAGMIFNDLFHSGLLLPVMGDDGHEAGSINLAKESDWKALSDPRKAFWRRQAMKLWERIWVLSVVYVLGLITFPIGKFIWDLL